MLSYLTMTISTHDERLDFVNLKDLIESAMGQNPAADCIMAPGCHALSFQGLFDHICHVEAQLRAAKIGPGDCVSSALPNGADSASVHSVRLELPLCTT